MSRRARQVLVDALLEQLAEQRQRVYVLSTYGVRRAGLRELKRELHATQARLVELTR